MVLGGRVEVTVRFDNIYEASGWVEREFHGFRKDALLVFRFNNPEDMAKAKANFMDSFVIGNKFYVPMGNINPKFLCFFDDATRIIRKTQNCGGLIIEVQVTATKEADTVEALDDLFNDVRREIELWNFFRDMVSLPKERV